MKNVYLDTYVIILDFCDFYNSAFKLERSFTNHNILIMR